MDVHNAKQTFEELLSEAKHGSDFAQLDVGLCYIEGKGVEQNERRHSTGFKKQQRKIMLMHCTCLAFVILMV